MSSDEIREVVQEEIEKRLNEEKDKLRKEIKQEGLSKNEKGDSESVSRRGFLKKIGLGALGAGALGITSASSLRLTGQTITQDGTNIWEGGLFNTANSVQAESPGEVTSSRSVDTQYTNDTGGPLVVYVNADDNGYDEGAVHIKVDGKLVVQTSGGSADTEFVCGSCIVPEGSTYTVTAPGGANEGSLHTWFEQSLSLG